jgi:hypothetical protein
MCFERFEDFVETLLPHGLGEDLRVLKNLCCDDTEALNELDKVTKREPCKDAAVDNVNITGRPDGNSRAAALRRLRKDRPDLHELVLANELTAHGAMVKAG